MARLVIDRALRGNAANSWPRWKRCWGLARRLDLPGHRPRRALRNPPRRELRSDEGQGRESEYGRQCLEASARKAVGRFAVANFEGIARISEKVSYAIARGQADVWTTGALPFFAAVFSFAYG